MNMYTWTIKTMSQKGSLESRYKEIVEKLDLIISLIDDLVEDPIFIDNIHGEQEMSLDLVFELFETIKSQFEPEPPEAPFSPPKKDESYDAD